MPAPPDESEPAMVSATGTAISTPKRHKDANAACCCQQGLRRYIEVQDSPFGDDSDGALFHPDQMQARPILCRRQCTGGGRDCLRDLLDRGPLRSARQILCPCGYRYRPLRERKGAGDSGHPGHPHHHHLQGVRRRLGIAVRRTASLPLAYGSPANESALSMALSRISSDSFLSLTARASCRVPTIIP